ncbi:MAG: host-nuclease inhibitor Gam family protein [Candidatus Portnoybacteria bacterium]|nr:host-nuclease inhibitor Gam family protein [Candidatus Portnoybacteria bacterium]
MVEKKKRERIKSPARKVPQGLAEVAEFIQKIGKVWDRKTTIEADLNKEVRKLTTKAMRQIEALEEASRGYFEAIEAFAASRYDELTQEGKRKTLELPTGDFGWRKMPLSIEVIDQDKAVAALKKEKLKEAIRVKEEVDKNILKKLLKKTPDLLKRIRNILVKQPEELFWVEPKKLELAIEIKDGKLKDRKPTKKTEKKTK